MTRSVERKRTGPPKVSTQVEDVSGQRHPFLRGMVTHDLVQRGLPFEDAYAAAHALRDRLAGIEVVSTAELKDHLEHQLEEMFGAAVAARLGPSARPTVEISVTIEGRHQPFSRGLLARSIYAAGPDLDRAYRLVTMLEGELRRERVQRLPFDELVCRVGDLLEREEGSETADRYRLLRGLRRLPRPVVIYLGGASGTGKSTLALELAPLLQIFRINATDTIRQVMRMVFSPAILPSLHRSSFEVGQGFDVEEGGEQDFRQRIISAFEEQSNPLMDGVRGVVERSVAENVSLLVEGVHLLPPHVPFQDLRGSAYQVMLNLSTLDAETHRSRFLARNPLGMRRAERYLRSFDAIRCIQEHLLALSEAHDVPMLDTGELDSTLSRTVRLLTSVLQREVPRLTHSERREPPVATLLLVVDGMPDHPVRALGGRTPLQAARTPHLDRLAREGACGLADPVAPEVVPDTAAGSLALFGQSPLALKRGPVEALGAGLSMLPGDVALRGNFANVNEEGVIVDRRAGRIRGEALDLADALDHLRLPGVSPGELDVRVRASTEHRLAIVFSGPGLSAAVAGSDPGEGAAPGPPLSPRAIEVGDERAARTAQLLALFEAQARRVLAEHPVNLRRREKGMLPANAVLTRGAGRVHQLVPLDQAGLPLRLTCISGDGTVLGIAAGLGATTRRAEGMTANLDTDLELKFRLAGEALAGSDLVVVHVKGADIAAHDRRPDAKVAFLERLDVALGHFLDHYAEPLRVVVAADHATLSESGQHAADPVPVLVWGPGVEADAVASFDEIACASGSLRRFPLQLLMPRLFDR